MRTLLYATAISDGITLIKYIVCFIYNPLSTITATTTTWTSVGLRPKHPTYLSPYRHGQGLNHALRYLVLHISELFLAYQMLHQRPHTPSHQIHEPVRMLRAHLVEVLLLGAREDGLSQGSIGERDGRRTRTRARGGQGRRGVKGR